ncbi:MAG: SMC family ATPase [Candidatus Nanopelagicales bacterium]
MRVLRGHVYNYRSIEDLQISFDEKGIHALLGAPGSGKSSFLGAIGFSLFGDPGRNLDQGDLRYELAEEGAIVGADFLWEHGQDVYRTVREMRQVKRGGKLVEQASARMWRNDVEIEGMTPTVLTREVARVIGMGPRAFRGANMIAQGEVDTLATATPAEVAALVEEHTGIAPLTKLRDNAMKKATAAQATADATVGNPEDVARTEANEKEARDAVAAAEAEHTVTTERAARARSEWSTADLSASTLRAAERASATSRNNVVAANGVVAAARERWIAAQMAAEDLTQGVSLEDLRVAGEKIQDQLGSLAAGGTTLKSAVAEAHRTRQEADSARARAAGIDRAAIVETMSAARTSAEIAEHAGREADQAMAARRSDAARLGKAVATLEEAGGDAHCPTCQQTLADRRHTAAVLAEQRDAAASEALDAGQRAQSARTQFDAARKTIAACEAQVRAADQAEQRADELEQAAGLASQRRTTAQASLSSSITAIGCTIDPDADPAAVLKAALDAYARLRENLATANKQVAAHDEVAAAHNHLNQAQQHAESAKAAVLEAPDPEDVVLAEADTVGARSRLDEANRDASATQALLSSAQTGLMQIENEGDIARDQWKRKQAALLAAEKARGIADTLTALRQDILADFTRQIADAASELLHRFGGEQVAFHLDSDFVPRVELLDGRIRKTKLLSGGEKARAGLAFRLGISMQITEGGLPDQIFGDEITQFLDDAGRRAVIETVGDLFVSPILISHTEEVLDYAATVHKLRRAPLGATELAEFAA